MLLKARVVISHEQKQRLTRLRLHIVPKPDHIAILPTPQGENIEQNHHNCCNVKETCVRVSYQNRNLMCLTSFFTCPATSFKAPSLGYSKVPIVGFQTQSSSTSSRGVSCHGTTRHRRVSVGEEPRELFETSGRWPCLAQLGLSQSRGSLNKLQRTCNHNKKD